MAKLETVDASVPPPSKRPAKRKKTFKKKREKWTEPRDLSLVAEKLAVLRDTSVEEIARITVSNTLKLFGSRSQLVSAVLDPPLP